jgi:hypothetical protein
VALCVSTKLRRFGLWVCYVLALEFERIWRGLADKGFDLTKKENRKQQAFVLLPLCASLQTDRWTSQLWLEQALLLFLGVKFWDVVIIKNLIPHKKNTTKQKGRRGDQTSLINTVICEGLTIWEFKSKTTLTCTTTRECGFFLTQKPMMARNTCVR